MLHRLPSCCPMLDPGMEVHLRLVRERDASFILDLRANPDLGRYLSPTSPSLADQQGWISAYLDRERVGREYYFILVHRGEDFGTVRLSDFEETNGQPISFQFGSWIVKRPRPFGLVWRSFILSMGLGFEILNFPHARIEALKANTKVVEFFLRNGAIKIAEDDRRWYFELSPDRLQRAMLSNRR